MMNMAVDTSRIADTSLKSNVSSIDQSNFSQEIKNAAVNHAGHSHHGFSTSFQANVASFSTDQASYTPAAQGSAAPGGGTQVDAVLTQAMQQGLLKISGSPEQVQETMGMLSALANANPDVMQNLMDKFQSGEGLSITTQDSGGPISPTQGNSRVNEIGGNQILLDFGDEPIAGEGGMLTVLAHELLHTTGGEHGPAMDQATMVDVDNALNYVRSA